MDYTCKIVGSKDNEWEDFRRVSNMLLKLRMERGLVTNKEEDAKMRQTKMRSKMWTWKKIVIANIRQSAMKAPRRTMKRK